MKLKPFGLLPMSQQNDLFPIPIGQAGLAAVGASFQQMTFVREVGERLSGSSDVSGGKESEGAHTKFEIGVVVEMGNELNEYVVSVLEMGTEEGDGFQGFANTLFNIMRRYLPKIPVQYRNRKQGKLQWETALPEWYQGKYSFALHGTSQAWNPEVRVSKAKALLDTSDVNPFMALSPLDTPELALEKIRSRWTAWRDFYAALGDQDPEEWIRGEPETIEEALPTIAVINPMVADTILAAMQAQIAATTGEDVPLAGVPPGGQAVPGIAGGDPARQGAFGGSGVQNPAGNQRLGATMQ